MYSTNSDYAVNKNDPEAIVCRSVTGGNVRLTHEDFASDEEFEKWKHWSDNDYKKSESRDRAFNDRKRSLAAAYLLDRQEYSNWLAAELRAHEEAQREEFVSLIRSALTDTQFRRLWQRFACGYDLAEIVASEGVSVAAVADSIRFATKRLKALPFSEDSSHTLTSQGLSEVLKRSG